MSFFGRQRFLENSPSGRRRYQFWRSGPFSERVITEYEPEIPDRNYGYYGVGRGGFPRGGGRGRCFGGGRGRNSGMRG